MAATELVFTISKAAMRMIKAGNAVLSSGGVRDLAGKLIELAKPVASSTSSALSGVLGSLNPYMAVTNLASSLASNVQCAFIQAGVNKANVKLDDVLVKLDNITKAMGSLSSIQALSWVNTAFSLANCGISVAGFYMTLTKLNGITEQLQKFFDCYKQDRQNDRVQQFNEILDNLKSDLGTLRNRAVNDIFTENDFRNADPSVTRLINEATAFEESVIDDFINQRIDGTIACRLSSL